MQNQVRLHRVCGQRPNITDLARLAEQGIYDPTNSSQANLQVAIDSFTQYIYNVSSWAQDLGKPALIEEFGMARNEWENVARGAPNSSYLYNDTAGISNKVGRSRALTPPPLHPSIVTVI